MVSLSNFNPLNMFGKKQESPAKAAAPYFRRAENTMRQYADPYIQRGNEQYEGLSNVYSQMGQDPAAFLESIMSSYQPSSGYQLALDEATQAASAAAAAGGYRGTPEDTMRQGALAQRLMGDDMQQYIQNVLGIQGRGLGGQQGFYNQGFQASTGLGSDLANLYSSQGSLAFQDQRQKNQRQNELKNALMQAAMMTAGAFI